MNYAKISLVTYADFFAVNTAFYGKIQRAVLLEFSVKGGILAYSG